MKKYINNLLQRYKQKGLLIDTNILLVLFVGKVNRQRISQFNRTEGFTAKDYDVLIKIIKRFSKIVTTPNILTEVNSLINQLKEPERSQCLELFSDLLSRVDEFYLESKRISEIEKFSKFGLTDCGILDLAKDRYLVLTNDFKLANYLESRGIDTINFTHIQQIHLF
ncbi:MULTISPECIES: PIN domain-containing protein [Spirulina sp. CCY15215]|uniref:PIN domain-containing protein n=1 Tax=Spirulina sp. CCY15215 TaxID=2767591 RepID=UPI001950AD13|nr:PIN domain-containing protein [Spirulina major]